ncbi:MAG: glucosaminidase domain-containing protein [Deltaproteobacteria bacterium]|nr:glucosaminidase domain-containing protein [Deltaproteobacteria bacterium]
MKKKLLITTGLPKGLLVLLIAFLVMRQTEPQPWEVPEAEPETLTMQTVQEVWAYYETIGYTSDKLAGGKVEVPRIYLDAIVDNWITNEPVSTKKSLFYRTMLPLVLRVNELIEGERRYLYVVIETFRGGDDPGEDDRAWLKKLAVRYKILKKNQELELTEEFFAKILLRVDTIPVSMALGQMAYESAYATSRFAGEGNALFGQWCWETGMLPAEQREDKGDYRIAGFPTPIDSVKAYAMNINTHGAYRDFRLARSGQRGRNNKSLDGYSLVANLERYSEKGEEYVRILQGIISHNQLSAFDEARLSRSRPVILNPRQKGSSGEG